MYKNVRILFSPQTQCKIHKTTPLKFYLLDARDRSNKYTLLCHFCCTPSANRFSNSNWCHHDVNHTGRERMRFWGVCGVEHTERFLTSFVMFTQSLINVIFAFFIFVFFFVSFHFSERLLFHPWFSRHLSSIDQWYFHDYFSNPTFEIFLPIDYSFYCVLDKILLIFHSTSHFHRTCIDAFMLSFLFPFFYAFSTPFFHHFFHFLSFFISFLFHSYHFLINSLSIPYHPYQFPLWLYGHSLSYRGQVPQNEWFHESVQTKKILQDMFHLSLFFAWWVFLDCFDCFVACSWSSLIAPLSERGFVSWYRGTWKIYRRMIHHNHTNLFLHVILQRFISLFHGRSVFLVQIFKFLCSVLIGVISLGHLNIFKKI